MQTKTFILPLVVCSSLVHAECVGNDTIKTCTDLNTGDTYTVSQYGNVTESVGGNSLTGTSWNQSSLTFGNTTYSNGADTQGNTWESSSTHLGPSKTPPLLPPIQIQSPTQNIYDPSQQIQLPNENNPNGSRQGDY